VLSLDTFPSRFAIQVHEPAHYGQNVHLLTNMGSKATVKTAMRRYSPHDYRHLSLMPMCAVLMCTTLMLSSRLPTRDSRRGSAFVEFVLLFPMLFLLLVGAFDLGFFCYAFIATQDAARVAALYTSTKLSTSADSAGACQYVLADLQALPNSAQLPSTCNALPLQVTAELTIGPDLLPASTVTVVYQTLPLVHIPGFPSQITIRRVTEMRVRS
jgi:hypothetical protein